MLVRAFQRDFERNGPSVIRVIRTTLLGYRRYRNHPDARIRARFEYEGRELATSHAGALWAARKWYRSDAKMCERISATLEDLYREFGLKSRVAAPIIGRIIYMALRREQRRLSRGQTYEPPSFREAMRLANAGS